MRWRKLTLGGVTLTCVVVRMVVRFCAMAVLVLSLGLHWALLQTVAWTGMLVSYSQGASFQEAITKTFDGEHPCTLCKVVQEGRADEKKQEGQQVKPGSKVDLGVVWQSTVFNFTCDRVRIPSADTHGLSRHEEPPKPRPRTAFHDSFLS